MLPIDECVDKAAYIAGPMTGQPQWNFPAFDAAKPIVKAKGYEPISPADLDRAAGFDETCDKADDEFVREALKRDMNALLDCDLIVLLPGWRNSKGARAEYRLAIAAAIPAVELATWKPPNETVCEEADRLVASDRQGYYGHPFDDFTRTGMIWGGILKDWRTSGTDAVPPELVGLCMVGIKISRECHRPKRDNLVDGAGYFKTVALVRERQSVED